MLKILKIDKYISKQYLKNFFYILISFQIINVVIDLFDRLDMFVDNQAGFTTYIYYYILKTPYLITFMFPIAALIATILTLHKIIKNNEILIMFNGGLSFLRISISILIISFAVSIFSFGINEIIKPSANYSLEKLEAKIKGRDFKRRSNKRNYSYKGEKFFYNIGYFNYQKKEISNLLIEEIKNNKVQYRLSAQKAVYSQKGWVLKKVFIKLFKPNGDEYHIQIQQPIDSLIMNLAEKPSDFAEEIKEPDEMNFIELYNFAKKTKKSGSDISKYIVELNMKFSFPLLPFLVTILGLGIIIRKPSLNIISLLGVSMGISFLFWGIFATFKSLGIAGKFSPYLATWIPDLILLLISLFLILSQQKKTFRK